MHESDVPDAILDFPNLATLPRIVMACHSKDSIVFEQSLLSFWNK